MRSGAFGIYHGGSAHGRENLAGGVCRVSVVVGGGQSAFAADDGVPYEKLVEVYVPDQDAVDSVVTNYDAAEYKKVEADGTISSTSSSPTRKRPR